MENNMKIVGIVITAAICVIVLGSVLMPVFDDMTDNQVTFRNTGVAYMEKIGTDEAVNLFWDHTNPTYLKVNSENVPISTGVITVTTGYNWLLRYENNGVIYFSPNMNIVASVGQNSDIYLTLSNGTVSAYNSLDPSTVATSSYEEVYIISNDENAPYVMKNPNEQVYLSGSSPFYGSGVSVVDGEVRAYDITGTINEGATVYQFRGAPTTNTPLVIHSTQVSGYYNLFKFDKITFTANNADLTWNQIIVPSEVTVRESDGLTDGQVSILRAIPIMIIVAILLMVVGVVKSKEI